MKTYTVCAALLAWAVVATAAEPQVVDVKKIWDAGGHNAFTDLARFGGKWYCTFREGEGHVGGDGHIRVLVSDDGQAWESCADIAEEGVDLRDPKFASTPDGRLMIVAGGSIYRGGKTLLGAQPRVVFSADGRQWTAPVKVCHEGEWLWRVTWYDGQAYGVTYPAGPNAKSGARPVLYSSNDGIHYEPVVEWDLEGGPNETTLRFTSDGEMIALVRCDGESKNGWIGTSRAPYREWNWTELPERCGGPNFVILEDGSLWAAGRKYEGGAKTVLARMTRTSYEPVLVLPSGGDTSYPGLVYDEGLLWLSYYSSHEGKASIYLARIRLP